MTIEAGFGLFVALLLVGAGLSYGASLLTKPKLQTPFRDEKPTTLSSRGSYIPYIIGRRKVGSVFAWAGDRIFRGNNAFESGWHIICVGPAHTLHKITKDGELLFLGPINSTSHPSGTEVDLGGEGKFTIYWGEETQPINAVLESKIGIASRWPLVCYVFWKDFRLTSGRWPLVDYDIETAPLTGQINATQLTSDPYIGRGTGRSPLAEPISMISRADQNQIGFVWDDGQGNFVLSGNRTADFGFDSSGKRLADPSGTVFVRIDNAGIPNGDYEIQRIQFDVTFGWTFIRLRRTGFDVSAFTQTGTAQPILEFLDEGINPAHIIEQLLFEPFPHGSGFSRSDFSISSLESVAEQLRGENIPASYIAVDGKKLEEAFSAVMQDIGGLIPFDVINGNFKFRLKREELQNKDIPDSLVIEKPEIENLFEEQGLFKIIWSYSDRDRNFRDATVTTDNDALSDAENGQHRDEKIPINIAIDAQTASAIAERREQEELAGGSASSFKLNRGSLELLPGDVVKHPDLPFVLRVTSVEGNALSGLVEIEAVSDVFSFNRSSLFVRPPSQRLNRPIVAPVADEAFSIVEVPHFATHRINKEAGAEQQIWVPRIRNNNRIISADIYLSRDNTEYLQVATDQFFASGGKLEADFNNDGVYVVDTGPTIEVLNDEDIDRVLDLTDEETLWRQGEQIAVINQEICFLKKVTEVGQSPEGRRRFRLDGLIRARFGTEITNHLTNSVCYIFPIDAITFISSELLVPGKTIYVKTSPRSSFNLSIAGISPVSRTLTGEGFVVSRPINFETVNHSNSYETGEDITFGWSYKSTEGEKTGAGFQPGGTKIDSPAPIEGEFSLEIYDTSLVLKRTVTLTTNSYVYTNANLVSDFGAEPSAFIARLCHCIIGFRTQPVEITVVKVS